jgi:hypothetical protein
MMRGLMLCALWAAALAVAAAIARQARAYEPTSAYRERTVKGFPVLIGPEAQRHEKELEAALTELQAQLGRVVEAVPGPALAALRKVRIWVEWDNPRGQTAEFHPSRDWLKKNGYNPDKAGGVEVANAVRFVRWSRDGQPWMLLHELAHAYHFTVLGPDDPGVKDAHRRAVDGKRYDAVDHVDGGKPRKAYALTDDKEYFAELSEAYFGRNDFYPFTREDLKTHDPEGYRLMESTWGRRGPETRESHRDTEAQRPAQSSGRLRQSE